MQRPSRRFPPSSNPACRSVFGPPTPLHSALVRRCSIRAWKSAESRGFNWLPRRMRCSSTASSTETCRSGRLRHPILQSQRDRDLGRIDGINVKTGSLQSIVSGGIGLLPRRDGSLARKSRPIPFTKLQDALHADDVSSGCVRRTGRSAEDRLADPTQGNRHRHCHHLDLHRRSPGAGRRYPDRPEILVAVPDGNPDLARGAQFSISGINNPGDHPLWPVLTFLPGKGAPAREFIGPGSPPHPFPAAERTCTIILETRSLGSLGPGSPVSYRQVQVGQVTGFTLSPTFQKVYVAVAIDPQYRSIIRENTQFWNSSGTSFSGRPLFRRPPGNRIP